MGEKTPKEIRNNLVLELHVPDFSRARTFYSLFGFEELSHEPTTSSLSYLVLKREDGLGRTMINFYGDRPEVAKHSHFSQFPEDTPRGYGVEITIPVENVDKLWGKIKDQLRKEQIAQELTLKRWGKKDFRVVDPFGFYVRFTEPVDWGQ